MRVCRSADGTASSSPYSAGLCGSFEACVCLRVEVRQAWRQSAITAHARCRLQRTWRRLQRRWVRYVTVNYFNRLCTLFFNLFFILNQWINKEASKPTLRQEADTIQIEFTGMYALSIKVFRNFRLPYQQRLCCRGGQLMTWLCNRRPSLPSHRSKNLKQSATRSDVFIWCLRTLNTKLKTHLFFSCFPQCCL